LTEKGLPKEAMVAGFRQKTSENPDFYHLLLHPESNYFSPYSVAVRQIQLVNEAVRPSVFLNLNKE
jgi:hypothetical protein